MAMTYITWTKLRHRFMTLWGSAGLSYHFTTDRNPIWDGCLVVPMEGKFGSGTTAGRGLFLCSDWICLNLHMRPELFLKAVPEGG
jgi:hypothetical protein